MRTALFLAAGFLLLAASVLLGKLFSASNPGATAVATVAYVSLWLIIAGANVLPAAAAILVKWKVS